MKKLKPWLVIALVFVVGFAAGIVATRMVVHHVVQTALTNPDRLRDLIERRAARRLKLDAGQRAQVHEILAAAQTDLRSLREDTTPRFRGILSNAESRIEIILTPGQREAFTKLKEENRRLWQPH